ncbi:glycosyltransferase family 4 protein [Geobacillus subterraneus]|uniref:glycosyltransferase family 4 protein n=1 Tax=Geobacillus subterraneus TaxID=129338 RepID=UPI00161260F9
MTKVAHVCTSSFSHKILVDKLSILKDRGYDVHIVSSKEGYNEELMSKYHFQLRFINMNRKINLIDDLLSIVNMTRLFKKEQYTIVHTHTAKAGIIGRIAGRLAGIPVVIHTSHGLPFYEGQSKTKYHTYRSLEKIGALFCDAIASQNKEDIEKIKQYAPQKPIYYEGNGVDLHKLDQKNTQISQDQISLLKKQLNIPSNKKVILIGARLEPVKDHFFLLDGLRYLKENYNQNFICLLAGDGPLKQEILRTIQDNYLQGFVKLLGYQTDIYPFIKLADIVALTSQKEGVPRIIMEAMAFSKPVVATNVLGTRELVIHNETGYLVEYKNVRELAFYLNLMLTDEKKRIEFGIKGRKRVEKYFTEEVVVDRIVRMYNELLKKKCKN